MSIHIRKAQVSDTEGLAAIFQESRRRAFRQQDPARYQLDDFQKQTEKEVVFVAVDDEKKVLGFISVFEPDRFIHHMFVSSSYQQNEIGALLLRSLKSWLPEPYRIQCLAANQRGCAFYTKNGWREVERGAGEEGAFLVFELGKAKPMPVVAVST
jgi:GNAT superfamily N-acetyltransferase